MKKTNVIESVQFGDIKLTPENFAQASLNLSLRDGGTLFLSRQSGGAMVVGSLPYVLKYSVDHISSSPLDMPVYLTVDERDGKLIFFKSDESGGPIAVPIPQLPK